MMGSYVRLRTTIASLQLRWMTKIFGKHPISRPTLSFLWYFPQLHRYTDPPSNLLEHLIVPILVLMFVLLLLLLTCWLVHKLDVSTLLSDWWRSGRRPVTFMLHIVFLQRHHLQAPPSILHIFDRWITSVPEFPLSYWSFTWTGRYRRCPVDLQGRRGRERSQFLRKVEQTMSFPLARVVFRFDAET